MVNLAKEKFGDPIIGKKEARLRKDKGKDYLDEDFRPC